MLKLIFIANYMYLLVDIYIYMFVLEHIFRTQKITLHKKRTEDC